MALYRTADLDRAEDVLKRALQLAPPMANARLVLANVCAKLHGYEETLDEQDRYIAENPRGEQLPAAEQMRAEVLRAGEAEGP